MRFFGGFLTYNRIRIDWAKHLLRQVLVSYMTKFPLNWVCSRYIWGKESQLCLAIGTLYASMGIVGLNMFMVNTVLCTGCDPIPSMHI